MNDNIQPNPSMPPPDSGPRLPDRIGAVDIRKRKRFRLPLVILVAFGVFTATLTGIFYVAQRVRSAAASSSSESLGKIDNGTWHPMFGMQDGKALSQEELLRITLLIKGEYFALVLPTETHAGRWACKNDATPKQLDLLNANGSVIHAIYGVTDGILRIAFHENGKPRPTDFESFRVPGTSSSLFNGSVPGRNHRKGIPTSLHEVVISLIGLVAG